MKEDFLNYFHLESAYTVNHFIHTLHRIPLIKKLVEGRQYDAKGLKVLGSIYRVIKEIVMLVLFKILYYAILAGLAILVATVLEVEATPQYIASNFIMLFFFSTLIGAIFNNHLFDTDEHSYYALSLLRVGAKNYAFINYGYFMLQHLIMNFVAFFVLFFLLKLPVVTCLLGVIFVISAKLAFQCINLLLINFFQNHQNTMNWIKLGTAGVFIALANVMALTGFNFSYTGWNIIYAVAIVPGALGLLKILTFKDYAKVYKKEMSLARNVVEKKKNATKTTVINQAKASLSDKTINATSNKTGFAYLNDLFMKRHHKSLWGTVRIQLIVIAVILGGLSAVFIVVPNAAEGFSSLLIEWITAIMFLMYCLNRGLNYTTCLFVNCDHCFLTYPFFKEPKQILHLFTLRLLSLIKLNILPGILLGLGFDLLYYLTSHSSDFLYYFVFFVSPVAMSVFFSIHYMMLYYILQPFTKDATVDSLPYKIINFATYFVSYLLFQMKIGGVVFGLGAIAFCVIYSIIAVVLVYTKATKTFKIKR